MATAKIYHAPKRTFQTMLLTVKKMNDNAENRLFAYHNAVRQKSIAVHLKPTLKGIKQFILFQNDELSWVRHKIKKLLYHSFDSRYKKPI